MITYPLAMPRSRYVAVSWRMVTTSSVTRSPFSGLAQTAVWPAGWWEADLDFGPLHRREDAEDVLGWLASLNGRQGSWLMGDPVYAAPRGTWAGAGGVDVFGEGQSGFTLRVRTQALDMMASRGDYLQLGAGATARLHRVTAAASVVGSRDLIMLSIWPRLRESPAHGAPVTVHSPRGRWMLADDVVEHSVTAAAVYGVRLSCVEDLRPL